MVEIIDTSLLIEPDKKWFNHKVSDYKKKTNKKPYNNRSKP